jgi:hypothetical protein
MALESSVLPMLGRAVEPDSSGTHRKPPGRNTKPQKGEKQYGRSAIANGNGLLPGIDGRCAVARRFKDIASALIADQGGEDRCSESRKQYVRRFAAAACLAELLEAQLARGEEIDITKHALLCSTMVRVGNKIGVDRVPRDVSPTLSEHLASLKHDGAAL